MDKNNNPVPAYETDVVRRRDIVIGPQLESQMRIVVSGLKPGESYIVSGLQRARDGAEVNPIPEAEYKAGQKAKTP
jgi:multidrug efflux pump subunit AcrA (membrane-fusion protein)